MDTNLELTIAISYPTPYTQINFRWLQRFGFPLDAADGIDVVHVPAHDRMYQI
jgi:hypothetical protein